MKKIALLFLAMAALAAQAQERVVSYARSNANVTLDLNWTGDNYGTVQWQKSTDGGQTWTDVNNGNAPTYTFKIQLSPQLYRAVVKGDEACPVQYLEREVRVMNFNCQIVTNDYDNIEMEITDFNAGDAEIVEYGYTATMNAIGRNYLLVPRHKVGDKPEGDTFIIKATGLKPDTQYSMRAYFVTSDGSVIYGGGKLGTTLPGLAWSSEDWTITKNAIQPRFETAGFSGASTLKCFIGENENSLRELAVVSDGNGKYHTRQASALTPATDYLVIVSGTVDGMEQEIRKTVRTMTDYSGFTVQTGNSGIHHIVEWDKNSLTTISPANMQVEYPRMCRIDDQKILFSYHGGATDHWQNSYLRKSYDNGETWSEPVIIFDKSKTFFGSGYWRICNPEMTRLQNGWVIMTAVANANPETNYNCKVLACVSKDGGETWSDPVIVGRGRTWEPQVVQLPGGELELLVSSEAAWYGSGGNVNQEIVCARSTDNGETWTSFKRASYNPNCRDGMPVAIVMQGNKGVLYSIESIGSVMPVMVHRNLADEWDANDWDGRQDNERWAVGINGGGAPYTLQLPTGEIMVMAHNNATGSVWQTSRPTVMTGDSDGKNFKYQRLPLSSHPDLPAGTGAYYNAFFLYDNNTVWLLTTVAKYSSSGKRESSSIRYIKGTIVEK